MSLHSADDAPDLRADLQLFRGQLRGHRLSCTNTLTATHTLLADDQATVQQLHTTVQRLEARRSAYAECSLNLQRSKISYLLELHDGDGEVPNDADLDQIQDNAAQMDLDLSDAILDVTARLQALQPHAAPAQPPPAGNLVPPLAQPANVAQPIPPNAGVPHLNGQNPVIHVTVPPKDTIEPFSGKESELWHSFWSEFCESYHNKPGVTTTTKFKKLRSFLKSPAKGLISGLALVDANYDQAVTILLAEYGDINTQKQRVHTSILQLTQSNHSETNLRTRFNKMRSYLHSLQTLGENIEQPFYVSTLRSIIPQSVLIQIELTRADPWTISDLETVLRRYFAADPTQSMVQTSSLSDTIATGQSLVSTSSRSRNPGFNGSRNPPRFNGSRPPSSAPRLSFQYPCAFCSGQHHWKDCHRYSSPDSRQSRADELRLCFNCLSSDHIVSHCRNTKNCQTCSKRHHTSLCRGNTSKSEGSNSQRRRSDNTPRHSGRPSQPHRRAAANISTIDEHPTSESDSESPQPRNTQANSAQPIQSSAILAARNERVFLRTALVTLKNPNSEETMPARAILDSGSHGTHLTERGAETLKLQYGPSLPIDFGTFGTENSTRVNMPLTTVSAMCLDGSIENFSVGVLPSITRPIERYPFPANISSVLKRRDLPLADTLPTSVELSDIDLLIGLDYYDQIIDDSDRISLGPTLFLVKSKFGYVISGRIGKDCSSSTSRTQLVSVSREPETISVLDEVYRTADDPFHLPKLHEDEIVWNHFLATHIKTDERYFIQFPFKASPDTLPSNYHVALRCLKSVLRRLNSEPPEFYAKYADTMRLQESRNIIEPLHDSSPSDSHCHYIAHHHVYTPGRTTDLRVVFNASGRANSYSPSLNDILYKGPIILENLHGLLLRFRTSRYPVISDVEKAFLMVAVQESNRDYLRFLWLKDPAKPFSLDNLQTYRFQRLPFGPVTSPSILGMVIKHHLQSIGTPLAAQLASNTYVDNIFHGCSQEKELLPFYHVTKEWFAQIGMNLREFASNNAQFLSQIPDCDKASGPLTKVLGIHWNVQTDTISLRPTKDPIPLSGPFTKRSIQKAVASIFDPLGWCAPVKLSAALFLSRLWKDKFNWDDPLPEERGRQWSVLAADLVRLPELCQSRFLDGIISAKSVQLHIFVDASGLAFSAVVYIRGVSSSLINVYLLYSKFHLAPKTGTTIPCLELRAINLGCQLASFVSTQLRITVSSIFLWSDSAVALSWLICKHKVTQFVSNRCTQIRSYSNITFRFIRGSDNVADLATRGCSLSQLLTSKWLSGPDFLKLPESQWPTEGLLISPEDIASFTSTRHVALVAQSRDIGHAEFIQADKFSSLPKLLRVTALCIRFADKSRKLPVSSSLSPTVAELRRAQSSIIRNIQQIHFEDQLNAISSNSPDQLIRQLDLFLDSDKLLRCGGRLSLSQLSYSAKHPILLPSRHPFTRLIVLQIHSLEAHAGVNHTLATLRQSGYWIPKGRTIVQSVLKSCCKCKRFQAPPYHTPNFPPLPASRVIPATPFSKVGVDYFGHLFVRDANGVKSKVWILIFTCLSVRAVHLELVCDMTTSEFLLAFSRFCSLRGCPTAILSDNAPQFQLASSILQKLWQSIVTDTSVIASVSDLGCQWSFTPALSPWAGGTYERLIRSVKEALRKLIGRSLISQSVLQTFIANVSAMINSRPLTFIGNTFEPDSLLTPNSFLLGSKHYGLPADVQNVADDSSPVELYKSQQLRLREAWLVWRKHYLQSLRERFQYNLKQPRSTLNAIPKVGDIVIVSDPLPRAFWKLARIEELKPGSDGEIRSAIVKVCNGSLLSRPLAKLFPLEY